MTFFSSRIPLLTLLFVLLGVRSDAKEYYVDATTGDDQRSGLSPAESWKSLDRVNAMTFQPGDRIAFRSGCRWQGMLQPRGSGNLAATKTWITIDRYDEGELPLIEAQGRHPQALLLQDVQGWVVRNLAFSNRGNTTAPWRYGVKIFATKPGAMKGINLDGLHVSDVNGDLRKSHEGCGIFFEAQRQSWFEQLLIENCQLRRCDRNGICQRGLGGHRSRGVVIRGNDLHDIGGDGIKLWGTDGGLIERNRVRLARARCTDAAAGIWPFACDDTTIQFNRVSETKGTLDGQAFDSDYQCRRTLIQYNISDRNEGGFLLVCGPGNSYNEGTVVRYNLSVEDGLNSARVMHFGGKSNQTLVHNNTFVLSAKQQLPLVKCTEWNGGYPEKAVFRNNLVLMAKGGVARLDAALGKQFEWQHNAFYGAHEGFPQETNRAFDSLPQVDQDIDFADLRWHLRFQPKSAQAIPRGEIIRNPGARDLLGNVLAPGVAYPVGAMLPP